MNTKQAFAALERLVVVVAQEHFSVELIQNARQALDTLRAELADWERWADVRKAISNIEMLGSIVKGEPYTMQLQNLQCQVDLWQQRANAQLEITRAAVAIVAVPFQIYDTTIGQRGYRISTKEFEELQRAVTVYQKLAAQEAAAHPQTE